MKDIDYLKLLSDSFPTKRSALAEVINLKAILSLPKGNEFFFSDSHGEYQSFRNLVRGASGVVIAMLWRGLLNFVHSCFLLQFPRALFPICI